MPPKINAIGIVFDRTREQTQIALRLVSLRLVISDMVDSQIAIDNACSFALNHALDGGKHAFMDYAFETQSRIATIQSPLPISGESASGMKPHRCGDRPWDA